MSITDRERMNYLELNVMIRTEFRRKLERLEERILEMKTEADALQKKIDVEQMNFERVFAGGAVPPVQSGVDERDDVPTSPDGFYSWPN